MNHNSDSKLYLDNLVQVTLYEAEIKGQLSDGAWENTRPLDHWKSWCDATAVVRTADQPAGRNFWTIKDNYNLHLLIEYVGNRMLAQARLAVTFPEFMQDLLSRGASIPDSAWNWDYYIGADSKATGKWVEDLRATVAKHGITKEQFLATLKDESAYTLRQLRADLRAIKAAMKVEVR